MFPEDNKSKMCLKGIINKTYSQVGETYIDYNFPKRIFQMRDNFPFPVAVFYDIKF